MQKGRNAIQSDCHTTIVHIVVRYNTYTIYELPGWLKVTIHVLLLCDVIEKQEKDIAPEQKRR